MIGKTLSGVFSGAAGKRCGCEGFAALDGWNTVLWQNLFARSAIVALAPATIAPSTPAPTSTTVAGGFAAFVWRRLRLGGAGFSRLDDLVFLVEFFFFRDGRIFFRHDRLAHVCDRRPWEIFRIALTNAVDFEFAGHQLRLRFEVQRDLVLGLEPRKFASLLVERIDRHVRRDMDGEPFGALFLRLFLQAAQARAATSIPPSARCLGRRNAGRARSSRR